MMGGILEVVIIYRNDKPVSEVLNIICIHLYMLSNHIDRNLFQYCQAIVNSKWKYTYTYPMALSVIIDHKDGPLWSCGEPRQNESLFSDKLMRGLRIEIQYFVK